ncbi:hypothetical protein K1719_012533 [Acacia pycnantha]|nr:hypothetical protein K1719_012533 [Acacia pycnantha]
MMKAAGWDLDAAAHSIESNVIYTKRAHKKYAFESYICQRMFSGFEQESFGVKSDNLLTARRASSINFFLQGRQSPWIC